LPTFLRYYMNHIENEKIREGTQKTRWSHISLLTKKIKGGTQTSSKVIS
jgi:hypothetical protein